RKGVFEIPKSDSINMDDFELEVIDAGAEDIESDDETITVTCSFEDFGSLNKKFEELNIVPTCAELRRIPNDTKTISADDAKGVLKLIDVLEEDDDVLNVFHNMEMTDEIIEAMDE
ncbi:MAG: YebC/PmpR family DNA-binding transcriptional regulator, partial [Bacteroidales bacterium]|nr:YebC/PmpR family DNA-binding transcriptional regulator [Bacteroidales bacterium]